MSIDEMVSDPCPNCGHQVPRGVSLCPNCGADITAGVWPPGIPHDVPPVKPPVDYVRVTVQVVGGFFLGAVFTFFGTIFLLAGPIISLVIYFSSRKQTPMFANGVLTGLVVGLLGVGACFLSLGRSGL